MMKLIIQLMLITLLGGITGCSTQSMQHANDVLADKPTKLDSNFGSSVRSMIESQKLKQSQTSSSLMHGRKAEQIYELYRSK